MRKFLLFLLTLLLISSCSLGQECTTITKPATGTGTQTAQACCPPDYPKVKSMSCSVQTASPQSQRSSCITCTASSAGNKKVTATIVCCK